MLIVGNGDITNTIIEHLPDTFLLIDDGSISDHLTFKRRKVTYFNSTHSFNPLSKLDYRKAEDITSTIDAAFPAGENTLTKQNSNIALMTALVERRPDDLTELAQLFDKKDSAQLAAQQKINRLLLSPVLRKVFCNPTNFSMNGIVLAKLKDISRFDRFVLGNFLIANYKGHVVVPDFGFYGCPFHIDLIEQKILIAGVRYLDQLPQLKNDLVLMDKIVLKHCTEADARTLAPYLGYSPAITGYTEFIKESIE